MIKKDEKKLELLNNIDPLNIYGDNIGYVKNIDARFSNCSEENRIEFATRIANVCVNSQDNPNSLKRPEKVYKMLLSEAAPNRFSDSTGNASRALEFIPVRIKFNIMSVSKVDLILNDDKSIIIDMDVFFNDIVKFSYCENNYLYTNLRALINTGIIEYNDIPYNATEDLDSFKVLKCKLPMFVWAHIVRHTQISELARTGRKKEDLDYWFPEDLEKRLIKMNGIKLSSNVGEHFMLDNNLNSLDKMKKTVLSCQSIIKSIFKDLKYPAEIYQRFLYYAQYKVFHIGAWKNDCHRWDHLFIERNICKNWDNWTQKETSMAVKAMEKSM